MNSRGQAWYMDFAIGLLIFAFTIVTYFSYTNNFQKEEKGELDDMLRDANAIASSLSLSGYPYGWDNSSVVRIGISDDQKLNATKLLYFKQIKYNLTKKLFSTPYEYFVFFTNDKGEVLDITSLCGEGHPAVQTSFNFKTAYYYQDIGDSFLKDYMNQTFNADIYFGNLDSLMSNLNQYTLLVMEHPAMVPSVLNNYRQNFEKFTLNGSYFIISGELSTGEGQGQGQNLVGVDFFKKQGTSTSDRNSTINNTDQYLVLNVGDSIVFRQAYYVENTSNAINFKQIATFNKDQTNALARWKFGNGTVYFFSDFDVDFLAGNFTKIAGNTAKSVLEGLCTPINISNIKPKKLVKTERYISYNSKIVKMVVYVWE